MRVLGIDPGLTRCGVGVVDGGPGRPPTLVAVDVVRTPVDLDTARRLVQLEEALAQWVREHRPDVVAVERVFAQHNVQTVMGTAQAAGIAMLVAARAGIPVVLHTPSEIKAAITGSGRADKAQVGAMVTRILRLSTPPRPADAADALALAICHTWRGAAQNRYADAVALQATQRSAQVAAQKTALKSAQQSAQLSAQLSADRRAAQAAAAQAAATQAAVTQAAATQAAATQAAARPTGAGA